MRIEQVLTIPEQNKLDTYATHNFVDAVKSLKIEKKKHCEAQAQKIFNPLFKRLHLNDYNH